MTKKEKLLIKKAIRLIHKSNEYYEGMDILAKLVGYEQVKPELDSIKQISIAEFIAKSEDGR
jgi:hypothetical protein